MDAKTLNCPMCGAAARSDASYCEHCRARLATVSCPSCFGLIFVGQKFCPECGAAAQRAAVDSDKEQTCPRCQGALGPIDLAGTRLCECSKCDGLWVDNETFQNICHAREQQVMYLGFPTLQRGGPPVGLEPVRYLKCPACSQWMNRVNFGSCSGVIVDVCQAHGTWFDRSELRRVIEFVRAGGLDKARAREVSRLTEEKRRLMDQNARFSEPLGSTAGGGWSGARGSDEIDVIAGIGKILRVLLR